MNRGYKAGCFVPSCTNTTRNSRSKVFVHVQDKLKLKWCRKFGIEYKPSRRMYCCEDHLNLEEDLDNYQYWRLMNGIPKLKLTAKLRNVKGYKENNEPTSEKKHSFQILCRIFKKIYNKPSSSAYIVKTSAVPYIKGRFTLEEHRRAAAILSQIQSPPSESSYLKERLLQNNIQKVHSKLKHCVVTKPSNISTLTVLKIEAATHVKTENNRTSAEQCETPIVTTPSLPFNESTSSIESKRASVKVETASTTTQTNATNNKEFIYRNKLLEVIDNKPKSYIGLPKQYTWLISYIAAQDTSLKDLDLIMTLLKLKQNDTVSRICDQFEISRQTFSTLFHSSIELLANFFQNFIYMPTRLQIKQNLPVLFKMRYSNVQLILNSFEIEVQMARSPKRPPQTWTTSKNCNTIKYLIGSTPNGFVSYISKGYGGRISDKALLEKSDLIERLHYDSVVMADRRLKNIESILMTKNIKLLRPANIHSNPTEQESIKSKEIASLRLQIGRVVRRLREFRFLHSVVHKHVAYLDHMVTIACGLVNLQNELIKDIK